MFLKKKNFRRQAINLRSIKTISADYAHGLIESGINNYKVTPADLNPFTAMMSFENDL